MKGNGMSDVEVVERFYRAMGARDVETLIALLDPAFVVTQDDRLPWGGRFEGHEGFGDFAMRLLGAIDSAVTVEAIFEADGHVVQFGRTRGKVRGSGVAFDIPEVHRWRIIDGRAVEAHFMIDTPAMLEALGLDH
jgi:uncharacterized protein